MWQVSIVPEWRVGRPGGTPLPLPALLRVLTAIHDGGSIGAAARAAGISYRNAWGLLRDFEREFGAPLVAKSRGQGTRLSALAEKLLWADRRIAARLQPTLQSLASELEGDLETVLQPARASLRLNASHGFAVAALLDLLTGHGVPVDLKYRNSTEAAAALARRECDLAGFHVALGALHAQSAQPYRQWIDPARHVLLQLAVRTQGLMLAPGNPLAVTGIADLARPDLRFVNRQRGSGTRLLLDLLLRQQRIEPAAVRGYEQAEFTHAAVAAYIASGMADAGFGLETAARRFNLDFLPVLRERYFLACERDALEQPELQQVRALMQAREFRAAVAALPGYDGRDAGSVVEVGEALGAAGAGDAATRGRQAPAARSRRDRDALPAGGATGVPKRAARGTGTAQGRAASSRAGKAVAAGKRAAGSVAGRAARKARPLRRR